MAAALVGEVAGATTPEEKSAWQGLAATYTAASRCYPKQ